MKTRKMKIKLRYPRLRDSARGFAVVSSPKFKFFHVDLKTIKEYKAWIKSRAAMRKKNFDWNYVILQDGQTVGGIGIKIDQHRKYIGEIGYFVAPECWGQGIATAAVKAAEKIGFGKLKLHRLEIMTRPENKASVRVAIKAGYKKEGQLKKKLKGDNGRFYDAYLYAKVK